VLIYFRPETMRQIVARFADCLNPGGYLFIGHAETLQYISDRFLRHHHHGAFYYQRKPSPAVSPSPSPPLPPLPPLPLPTVLPALRRVVPPGPPPSPAAPPPTPQPDAEQLFRQALAAFDREDFASAERLFDQALAVQPEQALALVGKGLICANQGRYDESRQWCARAIRYDDLCPAAYLLRGLILDMEEQLERAVVEYQKALWLDRDFVMAHFLLAKVHGRLGQADRQLRTLRNAIRTLEKLADPGIVPFSGGLSRAVFLETCRRELAAINPPG